MVPRPLEQDPSGPARDRNQPPASFGRRRVGFGLTHRDAGAEEAGAAGASVPLSQVSLRIEDGLLMAFGPDGDPMPPAVFIAAAQEQPEAEVRLSDRTVVAPLRAAAVLEVQAKGPLAAPVEGGAADGWIRSMLGLEPQPDMASTAELRAEQRVCELTAFARELMISMPTGGAFLITEATDQPGATAGLVLPDGASISVTRLIERLRTEVGQWPVSDQRAAGASQPSAQVAITECGIQVAGAGIVLALPAIGSVRLVERDVAGTGGPRVGIFLTNGEPATVADLIATLGPGKLPDEPVEAPFDAPDDALGECFAPASDLAAGEMMALSLDWPETLEAAADGTVDLGVLGAALEKCQALLASATVVGIPDGASLSAGLRHADGSWSLAAEDLPGLTLRTSAAAAGDLALEITLRALQGEATRTVTVRRSRPAAAAEQAGTPRAAPAGEKTAGMPDASVTPIRLAVRPPAGAGVDPKNIALVIIGGVPQGAVLSAGIDNGDGSWMLSPQDLVGLELSVPARCKTDITLRVTALAVTSREGEITSAADSFRLSIEPSAPAIPLIIDPTAIGGMKALMIRDLPRGARLSAGTYDPSIDSWVVLPRQLDGLSVMPPAAQTDFTLTVMGIALGTNGRAEARLVARLPITPA